VVQENDKTRTNTQSAPILNADDHLKRHPRGKDRIGRKIKQNMKNAAVFCSSYSVPSDMTVKKNKMGKKK
jgi:hypothetical protein